MRRQQRAEMIRQKLDELYPTTPIPLEHRDAYTLLVAILLSAQCTDQRVNQVTPRLWELADNAADMAAQTVKRIEKVIRPCGLAPQKAKAIRELSRILRDEHDGQPPASWEVLESLPGVGHKTASVLMAQAYDIPAFPVDTHIHRLAQRWGLTNGKNVKQTESDLKRLFPQASWNRLHLQIIFYGREHCTARGCDGTVCEICRLCYPRRRKPVITKKP